MTQPKAPYTTYTVNLAIRHLTYLTASRLPDADLASGAEVILRHLAAQPDWLPAEIRSAAGAAGRGAARYPVYSDPLGQFELVVMVWPQGYRSPIYDQAAAWGVDAVLAGQLRITAYQRSEDQGATARLRRTGSSVVWAGETGRLLQPAECRSLEQAGSRPAITLHLIGRRLRPFRFFEPVPGHSDLFTARTASGSFMPKAS